jgi:hypothetical protein
MMAAYTVVTDPSNRAAMAQVYAKADSTADRVD